MPMGLIWDIGGVSMGSQKVLIKMGPLSEGETRDSAGSTVRGRTHTSFLSSGCV